MSHHAVMRMEDLGPEDFDDVDESDVLEVNDARRVKGDEVSIILSVPLTHDEFVALDAITRRRDDDSIIAAARDAIRAYVEAHAGQPAVPHRRAG